MKVKMGHNSIGECAFVTTKYSEMSYDILDTRRCFENSNIEGKF